MNLVDNLIKEGFNINIVGDKLEYSQYKKSWIF